MHLPFSAATLAVSKWAPPAVGVPQVQSGGKVRLSWNKLPGATGYRVWSAATQSMADAIAVATTASTVDLTPLSATAPTYYQVAATRGAFTGPKSAVVAYIPQVAPSGSVTYRALLVGNGDYLRPYADLAPATWNDAEQFGNALGLFRLDGCTYTPTLVKGRTGAQILSDIRSTFAGAGADDVSLFFYAGHGGFDEGAYLLCGIDAWVTPSDPLAGCVTLAQLQAALEQVPGRVIVILDCCNSGGFIERGATSAARIAASQAFNQAVIDAFAESSSTVPATAAELKGGKRALNVPKFLVMTACKGTESSVQEEEYGYFTYSLLWGLGWNEARKEKLDKVAADVNADGQVTFNEAYVYSRNKTADLSYSEQNAQVYPQNSGFVFYAR